MDRQTRAQRPNRRVHFQAQLRPAFPEEKRVIETIDALMKAGHDKRTILISAINALNENPTILENSRETVVLINAIDGLRSDMEAMMTNTLNTILDRLANLSAMATTEQQREEIAETTNIAKTFLSSVRKRAKEITE